MWWKKNKWKVIVPVLLAAVLAAAFWYGGNAPGARGWRPAAPTGAPAPTAAVTQTPDPTETPAPTEESAPTEEPAPTE